VPIVVDAQLGGLAHVERIARGRRFSADARDRRDSINGDDLIANDLDVDLIAGPGSILRTNRGEVASVLRAHGVRFGLENHPERTPSEVLEAIGDEGALGVAVDTGWWATQGYDPVAAIHELSGRLFHVHLKDVEEPGTHVTCMHGEGCARISDCVGALIDIGYAGPVSIEHHSFDRDPTPECARALTMVREQLAIHV